MIDFDLLRRWPDVEAPELVAHDATDRLLLDTAQEALVAHPGHVTVIGDRYGALTLGAVSMLESVDAGPDAGPDAEPDAVPGDVVGPVRVHQDARSGELALIANADRVGLSTPTTARPDAPPAWVSGALDASLLAGARVVLLQLPRGLDALDEIAGLVAAHADPDVRLLAGGRVKHMTVAMNDVLRRHFGEVQAGLARQKSRVLTASAPLAGTGSSWPRSQRHGDLVVVAHGAAFAGASVDIGTRALLEALAVEGPRADHVVDLGCGTGVLGVTYARAHPEARVVATDQSAAAVASAVATAEANGVADRVEVRRDDAGASLPEGSADLVLLNPPFHVGATVHAGIAYKLFDAAARVLRPGGELWCVWNSHLGYRPALQRIVGPTRQVSRDARFTVTVSTRR